MVYTDSGDGPPIVFVHGNPSSGAEFDAVVSALGSSYRCIAPDLIGFGDSDKPTEWSYLPDEHAQLVASLLDELDLQDVTMVVGDWGGPIGLSWCLNNPERVRRLVITNTWLWSVRASLYYRGFSGFMGGPIGRYLIKNHNIFATQVVKQAWGTRSELTPELHATFTSVHPDKETRKGMWVFPKQIIGSSDWLAQLWSRREVLADIDMTLLWGMTDIAFREDVLDTWIDAFPHAAVHRLEDCGHFIALEATDALVDLLREGD